MNSPPQKARFDRSVVLNVPAIRLSWTLSLKVMLYHNVSMNLSPRKWLQTLHCNLSNGRFVVWVIMDAPPQGRHAGLPGDVRGLTT